MSINVTTSSSSSSVNSTNSSNQVSSTVSSDVSKKSTDSSFKEEMDKVSTPKKTEENKSVDKNTTDKKVENKDNDLIVNKDDVKSELQNKQELSQQVKLQEMGSEHSKFVTLSMMDMNNQLSNDIQQMVNNNQLGQINQVVNNVETTKLSGVITLDFSPSSISMTQADAEFFVNLTQSNDVSVQNVVAQAQNLLNNGTELVQVKQSAQISQTLLNALMTAKENNQPLRIDFDQNVSVILRVGKDGALAANFIPGDKAVEQYLRNNIESLKNTFRENDLPYSDLSYSNRGSKQQKENRRNKQ